MGRPTIQHSIHGQRFGLGINNEILSTKSDNGLGTNAVVLPQGVVRKELTAVQMRTGFSSPTELVPAPGNREMASRR